MSKPPLVSIIIPTYNRAHLIGETLDSVLAQTYTNWECIIVDDGSSDNTDEVVGKYLKKDPRFKYYHRPDTHKPGGNGARNYGFLQSKGEYIQWFDSDDLMHPEKLEKQVDALHNTDFNFAVCQTLVFEDNRNNIIGLRHKKITSNDVLFDFISKKIVFLTPSALYRKIFLIKNGLLFDEALKAAQEWEFICRVLYYSADYLADDTPLVYIRKHLESVTYSDNHLQRKWNYYMARTKIFRFLLSRDVLAGHPDLENYLKNYFTVNFKKLLFYNRKKTILLYWQSLRHFHDFFDNCRSLSYISFVVLTGRGYTYRDRFIK